MSSLHALNRRDPVQEIPSPRYLQFTRFGGATLAVGIVLVVSFATRVALLLKSAADVNWNTSLLAVFGWGTLFDFASALWWAAPLALLLASLPARVFRFRVTRAFVYLSFFALLGVMLFSGVAEWVFWDEFGVRFNFIAVDYLVYTTEVLGNIRESYPMPAIYAAIASAALVLTWLLHRTGRLTRWLDAAATTSPRARWKAAGAWVVMLAIVGGFLHQRALPEFANNYNRELAKNGPWSLFAAFRDNQLDYERFYPTVAPETAFARVHTLLAADGARPLNDDPRDLLRLVRHGGPEQRLNVIQITVESLSAGFLERYGDTHGLTPTLNALIPHALVFDRLYATGNRTDRGMEALTLSVPPTPGRSLIKRPHNEHLFTLGSVFRSRGYDTAFIYGGFGYFDNMNYFFGENGYRVVDRTKVGREDITFANVWGACDEDLFRWTIREADRDFAAGKPFLHFVMTTSNHRPFTFPEGRIDLPSKSSGRAGGVKYTDYAIGEFLRAAATRPWFKNTIFVIVADHCASSAGKTELPVEQYHIPMIVYAPGGQVQPGVVSTLASQIDFAPTLLGLLRWTYPSRFYGRDVLALASGTKGRALIGNYQKLGLLESDQLGVLKPVRQSVTMQYAPGTKTQPAACTDGPLIDSAIAYYQTASWLFQHGRQRELSSEEWARLRRAATADSATFE